MCIFRHVVRIHARNRLHFASCGFDCTRSMSPCHLVAASSRRPVHPHPQLPPAPGNTRTGMRPRQNLDWPQKNQTGQINKFMIGIEIITTTIQFYKQNFSMNLCYSVCMLSEWLEFFERPIKMMGVGSSVTRLGDVWHFGQLLKAYGNNYFDQIAHIFRQFL